MTGGKKGAGDGAARVVPPACILQPQHHPPRLYSRRVSARSFVFMCFQMLPYKLPCLLVGLQREFLCGPRALSLRRSPLCSQGAARGVEVFYRPCMKDTNVRACCCGLSPRFPPARDPE